MEGTIEFERSFAGYLGDLCGMYSDECNGSS